MGHDARVLWMRLRVHQLREEICVRNSKRRRDAVSRGPEISDRLAALDVPEVHGLPRVTEEEPGGLEVGGHGLLHFDDVVRKGLKPIANRHGFRRRDRRRAVSLVVAGTRYARRSRARDYGGRMGGGEPSGGSGGGGWGGPVSAGARRGRAAPGTAAPGPGATPPGGAPVSRE